MTPPRPSATGGKQLAAVATAAIPVVMLSSLAMAAPAHAQAGIQPHANHGTLNTADVLAAIQARTAQAKTSSIPAAVVASSVPTAVTANLHIGNAQSSKALLAKTQATVRYTVRAGDTVSAIAAKHAVSTSSVLTLNKLSGTSIIYPGQVLVVTAGSGVSSSTGAPAASSPAAVYTVKSGDTLGGIAAKHNISLNSIFSFNGLSGSSVIYPGQKIKVGGAAQSGSSQAASAKPAITSSTSQSYTVKSGDTLGGIAAKHNVSLGSIFSLNALSSNSVIYPGQKVKVGGTAQAGSAQAGSAQGGSGAAAKPAATSGRYTIKSGDTLSGIAARHGVSMAALVSANGISANATIYPGKTLSIPGLSASSSSITPISPGPGLTPDQKVPNTFLHYTYPDAVVADANKNKAALLAAPSPTRAQMKDIVARTATSMGVDPALALAFAQQESGFNHQSVSPANAIGTMQVIPDAGDWASGLVGRKLNLLDPQDNVTAGVAIIRALLRGAPTEDLAIAGYYQGQYSVSVHGMFPDTRNYVAGIKANRASFR
ncbi:LysM peptidoglycan-binding domain-containing protein [Arthrobacter psychrochitiniphilus]|uniref:LysM peptidoglycan-binding domain-containing protein n=1 Tax=Arthrobacter psychrochitiniphilus TaxID=291045 RepID=UPI003F7C3533